MTKNSDGMERRLANLGISGALRVETFLVVVVHWRAWMNRKILAKWKKRLEKKSIRREVVKFQRQT